MNTSFVKDHGGVPTLFVNGEPIPEIAYITYYTRKNRYADFAAAGYRLFSLPVYFASQTINERSQIPPFTVGVYDKETPFYDRADSDFRDIIDKCPDAMIFPRINISLPKRWEDENPEELCDAPAKGGTRLRACFSSDKWFEESKRLLADFLDHVQKQDYAGHIIGYQISSGNTEEWFSYDDVGSVGKRAREKYAGRCAASGTPESTEGYRAFLSDICAERICDICAYAKELTGHKVVVGTFYGYTLECPFWTSCHHALEKVLDCPDVDFICSPVSYAKTRAAGRDHPYMLPLGSLKMHGKLYLAENDTRTHLTGAPNDLPSYSTAIWKGPDKATSLEILKLHFARAFTHGHGMWWFDMWGGWYDDPDYMAFMKSALETVKESMGKSAESAAKVALFIDEKVFCELETDDAPVRRICYDYREALGVLGTPYDIFLLSDFYDAAPKYGFLLFLCPKETEAYRNAVRAAESAGIPYISVRRDNVDTLTADDIRACLAVCPGVKLYCDRKAVICASKSYLCLHTVEAGMHSICGFDSLYEVFSGKTVTFPAELEKGKTYLFRL